jgi:autotransporter passenger strand-loop-strand repeat protein
MGAGDDTITLLVGSTVGGTIDGGDGVDTLELSGTGIATLGSVTNVEKLDIQSGEWTITDASGYSDITVESGARVVMMGSASRIEIAAGGVQFAYGSTSGVVISGLQVVEAGASATDTTINSGGAQVDWGAAIGTTIVGGTQFVYGSSTNTTVLAGVQFVQAGGQAVDTTIGSGALAWVYTGGVMNGVTFDGSNATLELEQSSALTGSISGWADNDRIDLSDMVFINGVTSLAYAQNGDNTGGTLTVTDGAFTTSLHLLGQYTSADFAIASDGHGGTAITNPLADPQAQLAVSQHA